MFEAEDEEAAAAAVREICHVQSRAELSAVGTNAHNYWHQLDDAYQAWKVVENAGA